MPAVLARAATSAPLGLGAPPVCLPVTGRLPAVVRWLPPALTRRAAAVDEAPTRHASALHTSSAHSRAIQWPHTQCMCDLLMGLIPIGVAMKIVPSTFWSVVLR